jgi:potassium-transporting ATPase KdpC subunit
MLAQLRRSIVMAVILFVVLGLLYPLLATGLSQLFFKNQANGSLTANGSTLIGQNWTTPAWFHGRPDDFGPYAANPKKDVSGGDNPLENNGVSGESGASNLGPRSQVLLNNTQALIAYWHKMGVDPTPDLVTTSGSGLDPDITPADALVQIPMVARATGVSSAALRRLISQQTHGAQLGFLGSSYIVVLQLNQGLAKLKG